jgi:hypothetical protein
MNKWQRIFIPGKNSRHQVHAVDLSLAEAIRLFYQKVSEIDENSKPLLTA